MNRDELNRILAPHWAVRYTRMDIGDGWLDLVYTTHIALLLTDPDYEIYQIKEKFGGLRYYTGPLSGQGEETIRVAESRAYTVCVACGKPGILRNKGWSRVLCEGCNDEV